jgi:hypothetical protein
MQLAFPLVAIPVANAEPAHCDGAVAKAVAVPALPDVLLVIEAGKSPATKVRKEGFPFEPLGATRTLFAV